MLIIQFGGSSVAHDLFSKSLRGIVRAKCPKESQGGWEEVQGNHPSNLEEGAGPGRRENDRKSSPCARGVEVSSQLEPDTSGLQTLRQNAMSRPHLHGLTLTEGPAAAPAPVAQENRELTACRAGSWTRGSCTAGDRAVRHEQTTGCGCRDLGTGHQVQEPILSHTRTRH